jgi:Ca2+-binding EF-hand superfamily protein
MEDKAVRRALCEFIRELAVTERAVEVQRAVLAEVPSFDARSTFRELAKLNPLHHITPADLLAFMHRLNVKADDRSSLELARSLSRSGNITFEEFLKAITPRRTRASFNVPTKRVSYETEYALARVLTKKLESLQNIELCRQDLERKPQGIVTAYSMLAGSYSSGVTRDALHSFITTHTTDLSAEDVTAVFDCFDKDRDGVISFNEFVEAVTPSQPFYRIEAGPTTELSARHKAAIVEVDSVTSPGTMERSAGSSRSYKTIGLESPRKREDYTSVTSVTLTSTWKPSSFEEVSSPMIKLPYILCQLMQREAEVNKLQHQMVNDAGFNLAAAFRLFDTKNYGNFTLLELRQGLQAAQVAADPNSLKLLFMRYDRDSDGRLSLNDFTGMVVPDDFAQSTSHEQELTREALVLLGRLFLLLQKNEASLEAIRGSLSSGEVHRFYTILSRGKSLVKELQIRQLVEASGFAVNDSSLRLIVRRLDYDNDGEVSYADFLESFTRKLHS